MSTIGADTVQGDHQVARKLSVQKAADRIGCSRWHVYNLIHDGILEAKNIARGKGTVFKIDEDEVDRYLNSITFAPSAGKSA